MTRLIILIPGYALHYVLLSHHFPQLLLVLKYCLQVWVHFLYITTFFVDIIIAYGVYSFKIYMYHSFTLSDDMVDYMILDSVILTSCMVSSTHFQENMYMLSILVNGCIDVYQLKKAKGIECQKSSCTRYIRLYGLTLHNSSLSVATIQQFSDKIVCCFGTIQGNVSAYEYIFKGNTFFFL